MDMRDDHESGRGDDRNLADRVADAITARLGQVFDEQARDRLAVWLTDPANEEAAQRWLEEADELAERGEFGLEFELRRPIQSALSGPRDPAEGSVGFERTNRWAPRFWRRRSRR